MMREAPAGWVFKSDPLTLQPPADFITRQFSWTDGKQGATVLATATVGNVIYAAIRSFDDEAGTSYVFAGVFPFRNDQRHGFGYKAMHEAMGPAECGCPGSIMRLLSPVEQIPHPGHAARWRAVVAAQLARHARHPARAAALPQLRAGDVRDWCVPAEQTGPRRDGTRSGASGERAPRAPAPKP